MFANQLAFALSDTAVYWIKEGIGILASVFVLVSFLFSNERKTRIINIVGAAIFVVYGLILPAYATSVMNGALIIVHIVKLSKEHIAKKKQAAEAREAEQPQTEEQSAASDTDKTSSLEEKE